jgi:hypothetical protein
MDLDRRWVGNVIMTSTTFLVLFNATTLRQWSASRPPDVVTPVLDIATGWLATKTAAIGLDRPRSAITAGWQHVVSKGLPAAAGVKP